MRFNYKLKYKIYEILFLMLVTGGIFVVKGLAIQAVMAFFSAIVFKDIVLNWNKQLVLGQDTFYIESNKKVSKELKYREIEFITISRNSKKYIAVGNDKTVNMLKTDIVDRKELVEELLRKTSRNKNIYVHENVKSVIETYK